MRAAVCFVVALFLAGCGTPPPAKPSVPFSLEAPPNLGLLKGEAPVLDVAVNWDKGEREDLLLSVALEPENHGVSVKLGKTRLERGVGPAQIEVAASETAAPGFYHVMLTAKGDKSGTTVKTTIAVKVSAD
jgi:hypothetical protein